LIPRSRSRRRAIYSLNARRVLRDSDPEEIEKTLKAGRVIRSSLSKTGFPADVMLDVVMPAMQAQTEGDDATGYRVTLRPAGANKITMWMIKEDGMYKILDGAEKPNSIGLEIIDRLQAGNVAGAQVLLDWVRDGRVVGMIARDSILRVLQARLQVGHLTEQ
jgi:hypothetical protein